MKKIGIIGANILPISLFAPITINEPDSKNGETIKISEYKCHKPIDNTKDGRANRRERRKQQRKKK